jgi:hypothetical protein
MAKAPNGAGHTSRINGYRYITVNGKAMYEHRHLWEQHYGPIPSGCEVHHKNEIRHDNRIENFELLTKSQHRHLHGKNRFFGVFFVRNLKTRPYRTTLRVGGKTKNLGFYRDEVFAAALVSTYREVVLHG